MGFAPEHMKNPQRSSTRHLRRDGGNRLHAVAALVRFLDRHSCSTHSRYALPHPRRQSGAAAYRTQPHAHLPCDAPALGGRDLAPGNRREDPGQRRPASFGCKQQRRVDPETLRRVNGCERRRQQLCGQRRQQMRLAVEQTRQCPRAQRLGNKIGHAPPGIANAGRAAARVAGNSRGKAPARVARAAPRDQDQVVGIPRFGRSRTAKSSKGWRDRQGCATSSRFRGSQRAWRLDCGFILCSHHDSVAGEAAM